MPMVLPAGAFAAATTVRISRDSTGAPERSGTALSPAYTITPHIAMLGAITFGFGPVNPFVTEVSGLAAGDGHSCAVPGPEQRKPVARRHDGEPDPADAGHLAAAHLAAYRGDYHRHGPAHVQPIHRERSGVQHVDAQTRCTARNNLKWSTAAWTGKFTFLLAQAAQLAIRQKTGSISLDLLIGAVAHGAFKIAAAQEIDDALA
jgi:hypothetical protein